jgi:hypothetical protein
LKALVVTEKVATFGEGEVSGDQQEVSRLVTIFGHTETLDEFRYPRNPNENVGMNAIACSSIPSVHGNWMNPTSPDCGWKTHKAR